jgi:ATP-dependent Clp protease protease subunit
MYNLEEFRKFAVKGQGVSGTAFDQFFADVNNFTPYVFEERRMPGNPIDIFSRLMADRIIFLGVPIDDYVANVVTAQLLFLTSLDNKRDIMMYINSPGGSVYAGLGIYDTMQYISPDVATICTSLAASMGAVLLSAGAANKRSALPHARIMIHQPSGAAGGQASDILISAKQIVTLRHELYEVMAKHTGKTIEQIAQDSDRDYWMRADEAKNYGLIDEILIKN